MWDGPVLVTGSAGQIGASLVHRLVSEGAEVRGLDLPGEDHPFLAGLAFRRYPGDVRDEPGVRRAVDGVRTIIHAAGPVSHDRAMRRLLLDVHGEGTRTLARAAARAGARRFVHISSIAACGFPDRPEAEDGDPGRRGAAFGYNLAKRRSEEVVRDVGRSGPMEVVVVRPGLVLGPGDRRMNLGRVFRMARRWPAAWPPPAPPGVSPVVAIDDLVELIVRAATNGRAGATYHAVWEMLPYSRLVQFIIQAATGRLGVMPLVLPRWTLLPCVLAATALEGVGVRGFGAEWIRVSYERRIFEAVRTRTELGWRPKKTASRAIRDAAAWYREQKLL